MTTTVDIPQDVLDRTIRLTVSDSAQEAVLKALQDFLARHDQRTLIPLLGTFEDFPTPEEFDRMRGIK